METRRAQRIWGVADIAFGIVLAFGVFRGLPSRVFYVDAPALLVSVTFAAGGVGLLLGQAWARKLLAVTTLVTAVLGALFVVLVCFGMGVLAGVHAPVGSGGALLGLLIVLLLVPYVVVFPYVQYRLLGPAFSRAASKSA